MGAVSVRRNRIARAPLPVLAGEPARGGRRTKQRDRRPRDPGDVRRGSRARAAPFLRRRRRRARPGLSELRRGAVTRFVAGVGQRVRELSHHPRTDRGCAGHPRPVTRRRDGSRARGTEGLGKRPATWAAGVDPPRHAVVRVRSPAGGPLPEGAGPSAGLPRGPAPHRVHGKPPALCRDGSRTAGGCLGRPEECRDRNRCSAGLQACGVCGRPEGRARTSESILDTLFRPARFGGGTIHMHNGACFHRTPYSGPGASSKRVARASVDHGSSSPAVLRWPQSCRRHHQSHRRPRRHRPNRRARPRTIRSASRCRR